MLFRVDQIKALSIVDMATKLCEVGNHQVTALWKAKRTNKDTGEVIQQACCKNCMGRTPIKSKPNTGNKEEKQKLNVFFASQLLDIPKTCENCGERLDRSNPFAIRSQTCHILPKSKFKSIATNPQNKVFMCCFHGCNGHGNWDNLDAEKRKSMKVYTLAIERFRTFENELTQSEKIKAYIYLGLTTK